MNIHWAFIKYQVQGHMLYMQYFIHWSQQAYKVGSIYPIGRGINWGLKKVMELEIRKAEIQPGHFEPKATLWN